MIAGQSEEDILMDDASQPSLPGFDVSNFRRYLYSYDDTPTTPAEFVRARA